MQGLKPAFGFAAAGIGSSILGGAVQPLIPIGTVNPLTTTGQVFSRFTGPVAVIGASGIVFNQLRGINL